MNPKPVRSWLIAALGTAALLVPLLGNPGLAFATPQDDEEEDTNGPKKKIALGAIEGIKASDVRLEVITVLGSEASIDLTDSPDIRPGTDEAAYLEYSRGLGVSAILVGKVTRRGLSLEVHNGATGKLLQTVELKGANLAKLRTTIQNDLMMELVTPLASAAPYKAKRRGEKPAPAAPPPPPPAPAVELEETSAEDAAAAKKKKKKAAPEKPQKAAAKAEAKVEAKPEADEKPVKAEEIKLEETPPPPPAADAPGALRPPPALELTGALEVATRSFNYNNTLSQLYPRNGFPKLYGFDTKPAAPIISVNFAVYPYAFISGGTLANIGLIGGYALGSSLSVSASGEKASTSITRAYIGVRGRYFFDANEVGLQLALGKHAYEIASGSASAFIPDVDYGFIRVALDGRFLVKRITLGALLGMRFVSSTGGLESKAWFPSASAKSIELGVNAAYPLGDKFDVIAGLDLVQYGLDFNPIAPTAAKDRAAGGATDRTISFWAGARFKWDGKPPPPPSKAEPASTDSSNTDSSSASSDEEAKPRRNPDEP